MDSILLGKVVAPIIERFGLTGAEIVNGHYHLHTDKLYQHVFIQGIPGSGKTELLKSVIQQLILKGKRVCIVDGAGNPKFAQDICMMAHEAGLPPTPVFKYGLGGESSVFHGFTGTNDSIYNRLVALLDLELTGSDGDHYRSIKQHLLLHVCGVNIQSRYPMIQPFEPPRSFQELAKRLTLEEWERTFRGTPAMSVLKGNEMHLEHLNAAVWTVATPFLETLDPTGFTLNSHPVTLFSINAAKGGDRAKYFVRYLAEAFKDAMGNDNGTVWIIDEVGMFGGEAVKEFTKLGRQYDLGLVIALQSIASLGEHQYIEEILDTTNTKLIMRNDEAEELRRRAGTRIEKDRRKMYGKDGSDKGGSEGKRDVDKIRLEDVKNLPPGCMFVVVGGSVVKVQSGQVRLATSFDPSMQLYNKKPYQPPAQTTQNPLINPEPDPF